MSDYFKETRIAQTHKFHGVIVRHCATLDFAGQMGESGDGQFQESFGVRLSPIGELSNTDSTGGDLGKRMFMITIK